MVANAPIMTTEDQMPSDAPTKLPLKVALLTSFVPPYRVELFSGLQNRVQELRIFTSVAMEPNRDWQTDYEELQIVRQKNLTFNRTWRHPSGFDDQLYVQVPYDTLGQLRRYDPDVIITDELGFRTSQALLSRLLRPKTGVIAWTRMTEHSEKGRGKMRSMVRKGLVPRLDGVFVHGESSRRYMQGFGMPDEAIFSVQQAVDVDAFLRDLSNEKPRRPKRFLHSGQISERKGILPFLKACKRWGETHPELDCEIVFVGKGPLTDAVEKYPLPNNVKLTMLGSVAYSELPQIYADSDILAYPTLADVWGLVVNEGMAAGVPILGSLYSEAVSELVENGVNGWTFVPDDDESLFVALSNALDTPADDFLTMQKRAQADIRNVTIDSMLQTLTAAISYAHAKRQ